MGHKSSTLKVAAKISVLGGSGAVDAIRLSYQRRSCCGRRWREIVSFAFPDSGWSTEDVVRNSSSNVASVPFEKLHKKDGDTPVKVTCMAGGVPVFKTRIAMSDLLQGLERTKGVLFFSLVVRLLQNTEPKAYAFVALFCNGNEAKEAEIIDTDPRAGVNIQQMDTDRMDTDQMDIEQMDIEQMDID